MKLINRYIGEVVRRLPTKERKDVGHELWVTMEALLPENYSEKEERELLMKFGDPAVLAGKYGSQPQYLIGPRVFDIYLTLLKIIIPIVVTVVVAVMVITTIFTSTGEASVISVIGRLIGDSISAAIDVVVGVFFWVTLVFVIIEWIDRANINAGKPPLKLRDKEWTPEDLKEKPEIMPKKRFISRSEPGFDLVWTAIWVSVYFNADRLLGIYQAQGNGLEMVTPIFNQNVLLSFWPLVLLIVILQVVLDVWQWVRRRWDIKLAVFNAVVNTLSVLTFFLIFWNLNIFTEGFLEWLETLAGSLNTLNWVIGGVIFAVALFSLLDAIQGFRKAAIGEEEPEESWKQVK